MANYEGQVLISGSSWLQGQGVDVYGNGGNYNTKWQCVELPQIRLYPKFGWGTVYAANGGASTIPEGSPSLERYNPGSNYMPVPGDLIIEHPTTTNKWGHVAVVDRVDGNTIWAVEQNTGAHSNGWKSYTYNSSWYAGGYGAIKCVLHSPKNNLTNSKPETSTSTNDLTSQSGECEVLVDVLNVRDYPSKSGNVMAAYNKGQTFKYDGYVDNDGIRWVSYVSFSGARRYVARRDLEGKDGKKPFEYCRAY